MNLASLIGEVEHQKSQIKILKEQIKNAEEKKRPSVQCCC